MLFCMYCCLYDIYLGLDLFKTKHSSTLQRLPGGRLNKKDGLTRYGDSHVKDKTS